MSSEWSDLLDEAVRRGAIALWRRTADGRHALVDLGDGLLTHVDIESAREGRNDFLLGLRVGLRGMWPIDVEVDYRPHLRHRRSVIVPANERTARTVVDLQTCAWCVDPSARLVLTESDEGDVRAEMT